MMGAVAGLWTALFYRATHVIGPSTEMHTLAVVEQVFQTRKIDGWIFPPPLVEQLATSRGLLERFRDAEFILTAGGGLPSYI